MWLKLPVRLASAMAAIAWSNTAGATLYMEPVINFVPGSGPSATSTHMRIGISRGVPAGFGLL